jgi:lipoprotein-anchoring transpeptidase ErfK/SrfK
VRARMALVVIGAMLAAAAPAALGAGAAPLPAGVVAPGVSIDGLPVAGLTRAQAKAAVLAERVAPKRAPLIVTFRGRRLSIDPVAAGYRADVDYAVRAALLYGRAKPATTVNVPLPERVSMARIRAILAAKAAKVALPARDATLAFSGDRPVVRPARVGLKVDQAGADDLVHTALLTRRFRSYALPVARTAPQVTSIGSVVVINRETLKLTLYRGAKRARTFPIAAGQPAYPTPTGHYSIIEKQVDPTWFPPTSPWAAGLGPVPPGTTNPLGTRWMGTSAPAIGIHGTPVASSVGTYASHGCIRMYIHDAEALYDQVEIGTPVVIV